MTAVRERSEHRIRKTRRAPGHGDRAPAPAIDGEVDPMASDGNLRSDSENFKHPPFKGPPLAELVDLSRERLKHTPGGRRLLALLAVRKAEKLYRESLRVRP